MKSEKITAIIVLILVLTPILYIVSMFYGNPFLRAYYYFEGKAYLQEKYEFKTEVCSTEYNYNSSR